MPNGITIIESSMFMYCSGLTSVTIGNSVTEFGREVFKYCENLTSINFTGTKAEWNAIEEGFCWNSNTGEYTIHCTDGDISR